MDMQQKHLNYLFKNMGKDDFITKYYIDQGNENTIEIFYCLNGTVIIEYNESNILLQEDMKR